MSSASRSAALRLLGRLVGLLQLIGGALLCYAAVRLLVVGFSWLRLIAALELFALGAIAAFAGLMLWREGRRGVPLSAVVQIMQLPHVVSGVVTYAVASPVAIVIGAGAAGLPHLQLMPWVDVQLGVGGESPGPWIGINLVALVALFALVQIGATPVDGGASGGADGGANGGADGGADGGDDDGHGGVDEPELSGEPGGVMTGAH